MTADTVTEFLRAPFDLLRYLADGFLHLLDRVREVRSLVERYNELSDMSKDELAELGLKPDQIAHEVFARRLP